MKIWIHRNGENYGPYPEALANRFLKSGGLLPGDWAWVSGMQAWGHLEDILPGAEPDEFVAADVLTVKKAQEFLDAPETVDLSGFASLDEEAAAMLVAAGEPLDLSGLTRLDESMAQVFSGRWPGFISLAPDIEMPEAAAGHLAQGLRGNQALARADLSPLRAITELDLSGCDALEAIEGLPELENLRSLKLDGCSSLRGLDLSGSTQLERLEMPGCLIVQELDLRQCQALRVLNLSGCRMMNVIGFPILKKLCELNLSGFSSLPVLNLTWHPNLEALNLSNCSRLSSLDFSRLNNLVHLNLCGCIRLSGPDLSPCRRLKLLNVDRCASLGSIQGLAGMASLERIHAEGCCNLSGLDCSSSTSLHHLNLGGCSSLQSLNLEKVDSLRELNLGPVDAFNPWSGASSFDAGEGLKFATVEGDALPDLHALYARTGLAGCESLESLDLSSSSSLERLILAGCSSLCDLKGLESLAELQELDLEGCGFAGELDLSGITCLERLNLVHCPAGARVAGLQFLEKLVELHVTGLAVPLALDAAVDLQVLKLDMEDLGQLVSLSCQQSLGTLLLTARSGTLDSGQLGFLENLEVLLTNARISGSPVELSGLACLQKLWLMGECDSNEWMTDEWVNPLTELVELRFKKGTEMRGLSDLSAAS